MVRTLIFLCAMFSVVSFAQARQWSDATGGYTIEAELFSFDDENVVLQREDKELGVIKIAELSEADREYLKSDEAAEINKKNLDPTQTWELSSGEKLTGRIVDFANKDVTIQRRRGRTYVNDRRLANLPEFYRRLMPKVIEHFDGVEIPNDRAMENWLRRLRDQPRSFRLEGVVLESADGDEYVVPFFAFAEEDRDFLMAGWTEWRSIQNQHDRRDDHAFWLESLAAAHFQNQELKRQIALINLDLQAIRAGLTSAWEVTLYPEPGNPLPPMWVVKLGRNSEQATEAALFANPGFFAGAVRRISR